MLLLMNWLPVLAPVDNVTAHVPPSPFIVLFAMILPCEFVESESAPAVLCLPMALEPVILLLLQPENRLMPMPVPEIPVELMIVPLVAAWK